MSTPTPSLLVSPCCVALVRETVFLVSFAFVSSSCPQVFLPRFVTSKAPHYPAIQPGSRAVRYQPNTYSYETASQKNTIRSPACLPHNTVSPQPSQHARPHNHRVHVGSQRAGCVFTRRCPVR
jgi:hypothetical protein